MISENCSNNLSRNENIANKTEKIDLFLKLNVSKSIYDFIEGYCHLANIELEKFVTSMLLHSLSDLINETKYKGKTGVFEKLGVR